MLKFTQSGAGWNSEAVLGRFCPMFLVVDASGRILRMGPTLRKILDLPPKAKPNFWEVFELHRPNTDKSIRAMRKAAGSVFRLTLRKGGQLPLKGDLIALDNGWEAGADGGFLLNLSFGISIVEAVREYALTSSDFATTDLAIELLYLVEAKSAAMSLSRKLNMRLHGAKTAAEEQAYTDTLTGLKNRRALDQVFNYLVENEQEFALMQLDLDYFKLVNDSLGHAAGDRVLQEVARVMKRETKAQDVIIRAGGDEFVLVFVDITDPQVLKELARRLIKSIEEPIIFQGKICQVSASIGATLSCYYPKISLDQMMEDADKALYRAKNAGRGRYVVCSAKDVETELQL